ncbi:unnamed protein product [Sphenostylis stenocarpa]|uniref:Uncharacterized protein n=1 Tax=Sphenostylis stenocarpa TaxID=92480 RepID=A0AA86VGJ5_9FABA|nr:unnamed protein product [Sphenostylis stenocarpa]
MCVWFEKFCNVLSRSSIHKDTSSDHWIRILSGSILSVLPNIFFYKCSVQREFYKFIHSVHNFTPISSVSNRIWWFTCEPQTITVRYIIKYSTVLLLHRAEPEVGAGVRLLELPLHWIKIRSHGPWNA